jgi:hypothetical protein
MEGPPGGWDAVLTKDYLDLKLAAFEEQVIGDFRRAATRLVLWTLLAASAGAAVSSGLVALLG